MTALARKLAKAGRVVWNGNAARETFALPLRTRQSALRTVTTPRPRRQVRSLP